MIDWKKSAELNNMSIDELKIYFDKYPRSDKKVVRICDGYECGKEQIIKKKFSDNLCISCSKSGKNHPMWGKHHTEKTKEKMGVSHSKENLSEKTLQSMRDSHLGNKPTPKTIEKKSKAMLKLYEDPLAREKTSKAMLKHHKDHPETALKMSKAMLELYKNPLAHEKTSITVLKAHKDDPTIAKRISKGGLKRYEDSKEHEKMSAIKQGQDYDKGEWTGYTDKKRPHLAPFGNCIHLNSKFEGSVHHHIMSGIIINIPKYLHQSIRHRMSNGEIESNNMKEINKLAFQYLLGKL